MTYLVVQLGRHEAIVARYARQRGALVFLEAARQPLTEGALPPLLQGLSAASGQERIVLALSPDLLFFRELDLPIVERRRLREVVQLELDGETALESDELVFEAVPLTEGKVLAIWGRQPTLAAEIGLLAGQKLDPEMAAVAPLHWGELLPVHETAGTVAITDGETLAVFVDNALTFLRALPAGDDMVEAERTLALLNLGRGVEVDRRYAIGGAAGFMDAAPVTEEAPHPWLPLTVTGELAAAFAGDEDAAVDLAGTFAVASALEHGRLVNLRTGSLAYTAGKLRERRRLRLTVGLAVSCLLLVLGEAGLRYYLVQRDLASVNASIATIYREVFPTRKKAVDEVGELRSEIKRLGGGSQGGSVLSVLKKVAEAKGEDVSGIYEAEIEGDQVRLKGDARSAQAVNDFRSRAAALFASSEVGEIKSRPDGSVTFVFRGTVTEEKK